MTRPPTDPALLAGPATSDDDRAPAATASGAASWGDRVSDMVGPESAVGPASCGGAASDVPCPEPAARVLVGGVTVDVVAEEEVVRRVAAALEAGRGGRVVTPNVDICRAAARDPALRELVCSAEIVVPDGMPLVWAAGLLGTPVPERVTGADLLWSLSGLAAREGWPVYLLGGPPGAAAGAARALTRRYRGLRVCGVNAPPYGFDATAEGRARVRREVVAARPRIVFVGLGFPRQDRLAAELREDLPDAWFLGCGAAIAFAAGTLPRAPEWMRRAGLEWAYRLACEPSRLSRRYLVNDLPFAARLLTTALATRLRRAVPGR